jgi:hypothetical protein
MKQRQPVSLSKLVKEIKQKGYRMHPPTVTYVNHRTVTISQKFTK